MVPADPQNGSVPQEPVQPAAASPRPRRWLWLALAVVALVAGGAVVAALWPTSGSTKPPEGGPISGKLLLTVRPPEQRTESLLVEEPGALPVRAGGIMSLQVQFEQPAFAYLVWLDSEG